ncbi:MAG: hypothetical protein EBT86_12640 [Actinobacteria bacterium]|jgi:hypothetical protein|nr:hypothetical protein [Actinomycetota bacterium]
MKLEMRAWDLDVRIELEDDDSLDQLQVLTHVRDLLDVLSNYEKVNVRIEQISEEDHSDDDHSDDDHKEVAVEEKADYRFAA